MEKKTTHPSGYFFNTLLVLATLSLAPISAQAADPSFCNTDSTGTLVIEDGYSITSNCEIRGDLQIKTGGLLFIDYTKNTGNVFKVLGDIELEGDGVLFLRGGTFEVSQEYSVHQTIDLLDNSTFAIIKAKMNTNSKPGSANKYMFLNAHDKSRVVIVESTLDYKSSWLLSNFYNQSKLIAIQSQHLPTEVYVKDSSDIRIMGQETKMGVWLDLADGATGTLDLLAQSIGDQFMPYSWQVGRDSADLTGVDWQLIIHKAKVGIGVESHKNSSITINGKGLPRTGELTVSYYVEDGVETLDGLEVGLQNVILGEDSSGTAQLTLNNTHLGPVAWQIYVQKDAEVRIRNSVINEVASVNGTVDIQNSDLQLAVIASFGPFSHMTISDSSIHSQSIQANYGGDITIERSKVYGSQMRSSDIDSLISVKQGEFLLNAPPLGSSCTMDTALSVEDGIPICNPYLPENAMVTRYQTADNLVTCDQTTDCSWN